HPLRAPQPDPATRSPGLADTISVVQELTRPALLAERRPRYGVQTRSRLTSTRAVRCEWTILPCRTKRERTSAFGHRLIARCRRRAEWLEDSVQSAPPVPAPPARAPRFPSIPGIATAGSPRAA